MAHNFVMHGLLLDYYFDIYTTIPPHLSIHLPCKLYTYIHAQDTMRTKKCHCTRVPVPVLQYPVRSVRLSIVHIAH